MTNERELLRAWYEHSATGEISVSGKAYCVVTETAEFLHAAPAPRPDIDPAHLRTIAQSGSVAGMANALILAASYIESVAAGDAQPGFPHGFHVKRVEGHGWVIDPPSGSRWVAHDCTPAGDLMQALAASTEKAAADAGTHGSIPKWIFDSMAATLEPAWNYIQTHQEQFGATAGDDKTKILVDEFMKHVTHAVITQKIKPACMCSGLGPCERRTDGTCRIAKPSDAAAFVGPVVIDRSHPNQAYVTYGFGSEDDCTQFIKATRCGSRTQAVEQPLSDAPVEAFLAEVRAELLRARSKFPGDRIMTIALAEEFGELCKAVLDESAANVRKEAVQTAVMCARIVLDGDGSVNDWRAEKGLDPLTAKLGECRACKGRGSFLNRDLENEWQEPCNGCSGSGRAPSCTASDKEGASNA